MAFSNTNAASNPSVGGGFLRAIAGAFARGLNRVQVAQMTSALNHLSDEQLEEIGVERQEILLHAEKLVNGVED